MWRKMEKEKKREKGEGLKDPRAPLQHIPLQWYSASEVVKACARWFFVFSPSSFPFLLVMTRWASVAGPSRDCVLGFVHCCDRAVLEILASNEKLPFFSLFSVAKNHCQDDDDNGKLVIEPHFALLCKGTNELVPSRNDCSYRCFVCFGLGHPSGTVGAHRSPGRPRVQVWVLCLHFFCRRIAQRARSDHCQRRNRRRLLWHLRSAPLQDPWYHLVSVW